MGHIKLVKWLLNQGANPSLCDEENHTAFFVAAGGGFKDLAILLYEEGGVDVEDVDIYGLTALDWAHEKWASVPTGCEEFEAIKTTIEWLLYQRASPCACAASLRPHMAFQLYPAAASDSSGAPVLASSAAPPGIRSPESALALALASTLNRRIYVSTRFTFSAPRDPDEDSDDSAGSSVDCLEKFRRLRIIIPEEGDEDDSPSVDYEEEEDEEEDEEGHGSFERRRFFSRSTRDPSVSLFDQIVAVGEESDRDYDREYLYDQASMLNRRIYMSTRFTFSAPRDPDEDSDDSDGSSVDCLEKFRNLRIIIPEEGDEDGSPSVDYEEEEDEEEDALMTLHRFGASRYEHFPSFPPPTD